MDAPTLLRTAFRDLHSGLIDDVGDLDPDLLFWQPAEGVNHIGFLLWHVIRDEDTVICQSVLRRRELWQRAAWSERFGMDPDAQGTGFESHGLGEFRYDLGELVSYAWDVWAQTDEALKNLDPSRLEEELTWSKEWKLVNLLTTGCLSHGWLHLGEMRQLRGLRGWKFRE